ncbi:hypothetical protein [Crassaminicella profunda]|uniref:hypothetical protein n=1 Tax=Crassaminicella profunda TaxID=1286698 RepID=UPI001CA60AEE|nr:hypothetical protein [Crassaminicella profunda]QZY54201.1 hypothetical protein K7H06_14270 [Crassaminicella profunda]
MFDFLFGKKKKNNLNEKEIGDKKEDTIPEIEYKKKGNKFSKVSEEVIAKAIKEALLKDKD